jgi:hypothetical protein
MKKQFATYDIAKKLKELGFNEPCFGYYGKEEKLVRFPSLLPDNEVCNSYFEDLTAPIVCAPLWQQVIDWFEDTYNIYIECPNYYKHTKGYKPEYECRVNGKQLSTSLSKGYGGQAESVILFPTKHEAYIKATEEAIKLIPNKK